MIMVSYKQRKENTIQLSYVETTRIRINEKGESISFKCVSKNLYDIQIDDTDISDCFDVSIFYADGREVKFI